MNPALTKAIDEYVVVGNIFHLEMRERGHRLLTPEAARDIRDLIAGIAAETRAHPLYEHLDLFADSDFANVEGVVAALHVGMAGPPSWVRVTFFAVMILQLDTHLQREVPVGTVVH